MHGNSHFDMADESLTMTSHQSIEMLGLRNTESLYLLYHIRVVCVFLIFFGNWKLPYSRASPVSGHPGT